MMKHFYTAALVLALAASALAQTPAPSPQEPTTPPPSESTQQPGAPPTTTPPTFPEQQEQTPRPESDPEPMVDDQTLHSQLHQQFSTDPAFRNVQISVEDGKVRLEGTVASKDDKKRAKEMAKSMTGVRKVSNKLKVDEQISASAEGPAAGEAMPQGDRPESDVTGESAVPETHPESATQQPQGGMTAGMTAQSSTQLQTQIQTEIQGQPGMENVQVQVFDDRIEITGFVENSDQRHQVCRVAITNAGPRSIIDRITVRTSGAATTSTTPTTPDAGGAQTRPESDAGTYPQSTPDTTQTQSEQSADTTLQAGGELKGQIEAAFKNEPTLTGTNVIVNVTETTVELSGTVPTGKERQTAKRIAQSYAGNRRVEDRMTVTGQGNMPENPPQTNQPNQTPPPTPPNF